MREQAPFVKLWTGEPEQAVAVRDGVAARLGARDKDDIADLVRTPK